MNSLSTAALFQANARPTTPPEFLAAVSQVALENAAPPLACAQECSAVMGLTCDVAPVNSARMALLIAQLVAPRANDIVFDFVCGPGQLLLACAARLAHTEPGARLVLLGMAANHDEVPLANMMLSRSGQHSPSVVHRNALTNHFNDLSVTEQQLMLGGVDIVLMVLPEQSAHWNHGRTWEEYDPRFTIFPPADTRLALAWLGLTAMSTDGGRMALFMPTDAFLAEGGVKLRQYMVELALLDAVITVPGITGYVLLMLHSQNTRADIGFIQTRCPITATTTTTNAPDEGIHAVLDAWQHYQTGTAHPCVLRVERTVVAEHHYEFDWRSYADPHHESTHFPNCPQYIA